MTRISLILAALACSLLGGCTSMGWHTYAQQPRTPQVAANGTNAALVCKDLAPTGSHMVHRECHTQAEWDTQSQGAMQQFNQDSARTLPSTNPNSPTGR